MSTRPPGFDFSAERFPAQPDGGARGRLRIYFGYAAGVGKTWAMLNDAREAKESGADVVAGYIEPHMRPETMALLDGIEALPPLEIEYKGVTLREFDLDGALARRPHLLLVDELAHTNAGGCRHKKRYQDVEELLQAGIDVYTTVNVQHLESLHDLVAAITGVSVRERIPDSVFDGADQIELVDIEPDDLIERLHKGKIYREAQAQRALENFFTRDKLIALREIALRRTADQVTHTADKAKERSGLPEAIGRPFGNEHVLVCLSAAPSNAHVVRAAARMAGAFHATLTALFVETPGTADLKEKNLAGLRENLRLAEQLGAQINTVYGENVPEQIAEYAKASHATKIVMGRSTHARRWFSAPSFVDRLSELAPNLDIFIIPDEQPAARRRLAGLWQPTEFSAADALKTLGLLAACTLVGFGFRFLGFNDENIITVYILGVLIDAVITTGWYYGAASSILSVLVFNYLFTEPRFSLAAYGTGYPVTFVIMLAAALLTSALTDRVKAQARHASQKASRTEVLLETNRKLEQADGQTEILGETARQLQKLLDRPVVLYPAAGGTLGEPLPPDGDGEAARNACQGENERAVAEWVFQNNKHAGATTDTLSAAKCLYLAVRGRGGALAVVGVAMEGCAPLEAFEKSLMLAILGECALALEKARMEEARRQSNLQAQQETLRANLLRTISHDLRTPLTSISGSAGILKGDAGKLTERQKDELYTEIYDDSIWLYNLVENLLSITRIEDGSVALSMQPELLAEVMAEALAHTGREAARHHIGTALDDDLLMAKMDARLMVQVLINLVDNAVKYTQEGSHITVAAKREGGAVRVEVADDGPGIPDEAKDKLFDMFYTADNARGDGRRSLGLGLYLCKAIVQAHGGEIYVRDNAPRGAVFGFTLPAAEVDVHE